jgi:tetratricopeptide (TPR) repeat protein
MVVVFSAGADGRIGAADGAYAAWLKHRAATLREPSLVRYYTFEDARDETTPIANQAGKGGELRYQLTPVPGAAEERFTVIEGRFPPKRAVRVDRGVFSAEPFEVVHKTFSVEMWFRKNGYGTLRGNSGATNGTLVSQGNGYWDGWRVTTSYPEETFGFEIGRPQPSSSFGFFGVGPLTDGVWHHLVATWDGRTMCLYLNGLLARAVQYDGDYTPPKPGDRFRIGYANAGWGSTRLDVDEVAVFNRALSAVEVLRRSLFYVALSNDWLAKMESAEAAFARRDFDLAAASYRAVLAPKELPPDGIALARLRLAECLRELGKPRDAVQELSAVLNAADVADRFERGALGALLLLSRRAGDAMSEATLLKLIAHPTLSARDRYEVRRNLARYYLRVGKPDAARKEFMQLMNDPQTSAQDKLNLRLELAHSLRSAGKFEAARQEYAALATSSDAPDSLRSYARLLVAHTFVAEKNYPAAKAAFEQLLTMRDLPLSHEMEAKEMLREVDRLSAGLPPRDPAWSRAPLPAQKKPAFELFVSPNGNDSSPGTAQRPLATFAGAQKALRTLKARGALPAGGVAVTFRGGEYRLTETVKLTAEDSGTPDAPIVYRAAPNEIVRFTGGVRLRNFAAVGDAAVLARLPEAARGKVVQVNLREQGISDFGKLHPHGFGFPPNPVTEVFFNGQAMRLARYPNEGWTQTGKIVEEKTATGGFAFEYADDRPARWAQAKDVWLYGYWRYLWADSGIPVTSIDPTARRIKTAAMPSYGAQSGMPYFAYNLLEELDAPGEWYLDRASGILYLYPPSDMATATVEMSVLSAPFVQMDDVSHVTLQGLTFELGRGDGIIINGGNHCLLAGCTIRKMGGTAVIINGGSHHGVFGCDLYTLGRGGTSVKGGDRKTLTPSGHFVENCHVYDFSRWDRTYTPAVWTDGVGTRIAHNLFHDSPGHALRLEGNDHLVEFNEIHDVVYETDDQGALDMFYNPTYRGVVIRYNFWHHVGDGKDQRMRAGVRLDDAICGVLIYGNVFYKCGEGYFGGVQIHGGKENVVDNNLFIDCKYAVSFSGWGAERWRQYLQSADAVNATTKTVDIYKPPYSTRYPALAKLAENPDVNAIWRNVFVNGREFLTRDRNIQNLMDNLTLSEDPGFVNAAQRNFALKPTSSVYSRIGFRPIPFNEMGLYEHPLRATYPVQHEVGRRYGK